MFFWSVFFQVFCRTDKIDKCVIYPINDLFATNMIGMSAMCSIFALFFFKKVEEMKLTALELTKSQQFGNARSMRPKETLPPNNLIINQWEKFGCHGFPTF